jgi:uncharacterized protein (DUF302 family)
MHMTRLWMTGCMALVLLAAGRWLPREAPEETASGERNRPSLSTRHGLNETVSRIERLARQRGLVVMAQAPAQATAATPASPPAALPAGAMRPQGLADARVLVLGDADGRTAAMQVEGQSVPVLPWQVMVRQRPDGGTDVWLPAEDAFPPVADVASDTLRQLRSLPQAVSDALV